MAESKMKYHSKENKYIPALDVGSLTIFFDFFQNWGPKEDTVKPKLISHSRIEKNYNVLDLGCGTGTLALFVKKIQPSENVTGTDIDQQILSIYKKKAAQAECANKT